MSRCRILLVDDDPGVRKALARILSPRFEIVDAADGTEAVARIANGEMFDVILLDLEMPMDGKKTFEEIQRLRPELADRVIVVTGGGRSVELRRWVAKFPRVVEKPADARSLLAAIGHVIEKVPNEGVE